MSDEIPKGAAYLDMSGVPEKRGGLSKVENDAFIDGLLGYARAENPDAEYGSLRIVEGEYSPTTNTRSIERMQIATSQGVLRFAIEDGLGGLTENLEGLVDFEKPLFVLDEQGNPISLLTKSGQVVDNPLLKRMEKYTSGTIEGYGIATSQRERAA